MALIGQLWWLWLVLFGIGITVVVRKALSFARTDTNITLLDLAKKGFWMSFITAIPGVLFCLSVLINLIDYLKS